MSIASGRIPSQYIKVRENFLIELLLLFEEGAVQGMGGGIIEKLEAVEDLDGAASLNPDDAAEDPRRSGGGYGGCRGGIRAVGSVSGRKQGELGLGLDPSVVIGDVEDH